VLEDDLAYLPDIAGRHLEKVSFANVKVFDIDPEFAFHIAVATMNVDGLITLVGVEKQSPAEQDKNGWHQYLLWVPSNPPR
jgi:carotenoid cleavage dioxygenase-like enzyme